MGIGARRHGPRQIGEGQHRIAEAALVDGDHEAVLTELHMVGHVDGVEPGQCPQIAGADKARIVDDKAAGQAVHHDQPAVVFRQRLHFDHHHQAAVVGHRGGVNLSPVQIIDLAGDGKALSAFRQRLGCLAGHGQHDALRLAARVHEGDSIIRDILAGETPAQTARLLLTVHGEGGLAGLFIRLTGSHQHPGHFLGGVIGGHVLLGGDEVRHRAARLALPGFRHIGQNARSIAHRRAIVRAEDAGPLQRQGIGSLFEATGRALLFAVKGESGGDLCLGQWGREVLELHIHIVAQVADGGPARP